MKVCGHLVIQGPVCTSLYEPKTQNVRVLAHGPKSLYIPQWKWYLQDILSWISFEWGREDEELEGSLQWRRRMFFDSFSHVSRPKMLCLHPIAHRPFVPSPSRIAPSVSHRAGIGFAVCSSHSNPRILKPNRGYFYDDDDGGSELEEYPPFGVRPSLDLGTGFCEILLSLFEFS